MKAFGYLFAAANLFFLSRASATEVVPVGALLSEQAKFMENEACNQAWTFMLDNASTIGGFGLLESMALGEGCEPAAERGTYFIYLESSFDDGCGSTVYLAHFSNAEYQLQNIKIYDHREPGTCDKTQHEGAKIAIEYYRYPDESKGEADDIVTKTLYAFRTFL